MFALSKTNCNEKNNQTEPSLSNVEGIPQK